MSERMSATTRAGWATRASCPPLTREMCLRSVLISRMSAPQARRDLVSACFSESEMPSTGAGVKAEPPPEMRTNTRSFGPRPRT